MSDPMENLKQQVISEFGTPCAVIDLDIVDQNIKNAQKICDDAGVKNRPHIKTHKSPIIAQMQLDGGASGITCQKLGEARVMARAGITDIVIATNLLGAARSGQLTELQRETPLKVTADSAFTLKAYSDAAKHAGQPLDIMIECETGQLRAGVETPEQALNLAKIVRDDPYLNFVGWLFYPSLDGWPRTQVFFNTVTSGLAELGMTADIVSTGGTPNFVNVGRLNGATEHRAGTCIFNDLMMVAAGVATLEDCAFNVYSSVVSRAGPDRGILDAGSKTLTNDTGGLEGFGRIIEHPNARIHKFAEEHGFLDLTACNNKPEVGDVVRVIPNHVCVTTNMFEQLVTIRNGEITGTIPVEARGLLV